jgi:hypothetical protein
VQGDLFDNGDRAEKPITRTANSEIFFKFFKIYLFFKPDPKCSRLTTLSENGKNKFSLKHVAN